MREIGVCLAELASERGVTQYSISMETGISQASISVLFSGKTKEPKLMTVYRIAHCLGLTVDDVVGYSETGVLASGQPPRPAVERFFARPSSQGFVEASEEMLGYLSDSARDHTHAPTQE